MKRFDTLMITFVVLLLMAASVSAQSVSAIENNIATGSNVVDENAKTSISTDFLYIGDGSDSTVKRFDAIFWFFSNFKRTLEFQPISLNPRSHFGKVYPLTSKFFI
jgi:hypothetical protein